MQCPRSRLPAAEGSWASRRHGSRCHTSSSRRTNIAVNDLFMTPPEIVRVASVPLCVPSDRSARDQRRGREYRWSDHKPADPPERGCRPCRRRRTRISRGRACWRACRRSAPTPRPARAGSCGPTPSMPSSVSKSSGARSYVFTRIFDRYRVSTSSSGNSRCRAGSCRSGSCSTARSVVSGGSAASSAHAARTSRLSLATRLSVCAAHVAAHGFVRLLDKAASHAPTASDSGAPSKCASFIPCWTTAQSPDAGEQKDVVIRADSRPGRQRCPPWRRCGSRGRGGLDRGQALRTHRAICAGTLLATRRPCPPRQTDPTRARVAQRLLDGAADGRRHAARMPVEPEHAAKCLKPERIGHPPEDFARAVFLDDVGEDFAGEEHHPGEQPGGRLAAVQGKRCVPGPLSRRHRSILCDTMGRRGAPATTKEY